jgi:hypothetical protein
MSHRLHARTHCPKLLDDDHVRIRLPIVGLCDSQGVPQPRLSISQHSQVLHSYGLLSMFAVLSAAAYGADHSSLEEVFIHHCSAAQSWCHGAR